MVPAFRALLCSDIRQVSFGVENALFTESIHARGRAAALAVPVKICGDLPMD
jgi:hypothetical protein